MKRFVVLPKSIFITVFVAVFFACLSPGKTEIYAAGIDKNDKVVDVVDGDTIILQDGRKIRYIGINTPEIMKRGNVGWIYDPERKALEAKQVNYDLVYGKGVTLEWDAVVKDRYGRWLAYVYLPDGRMVNQILISKGVAEVFTMPPNIIHYDEFIAAQKEAMASEVGIWSDVIPVDCVEARKNIGEYVRLTDEVSRSYRKGQWVIIQMGKTKGTGIKVFIPLNNIVFFQENGVDPEKDYTGHELEITGKVNKRFGVSIIVDNPGQIKIIN